MARLASMRVKCYGISNFLKTQIGALVEHRLYLAVCSEPQSHITLLMLSGSPVYLRVLFDYVIALKISDALNDAEE